MLLHKTTREALGIKLEGNIVIIDEAHNLIDTVTEIHSTTVSLAQITRCRGALFSYFTKYQTRLKGKNVVYIRQLLNILDAFTKCLQPPPPPLPFSSSKDSPTPKVPVASKPQQQQAEQLIFQVNDFLIRLRIDNINFHKILAYLQTSELSKKLRGFVDKYGGEGVTIHGQEGAQLKMSSPLFLIEPFLHHLANYEKDGRVLILKEEKSVSLRYLLLNPRDPFTDLVTQARSVIMAGGTMQPVCSCPLG